MLGRQVSMPVRGVSPAARWPLWAVAGLLSTRAGACHLLWASADPCLSLPHVCQTMLMPPKAGPPKKTKTQRWPQALTERSPLGPLPPAFPAAHRDTMYHFNRSEEYHPLAASTVTMCNLHLRLVPGFGPPKVGLLPTEQQPPFPNPHHRPAVNLPEFTQIKSHNT